MNTRWLRAFPGFFLLMLTMRALAQAPAPAADVAPVPAPAPAAAVPASVVKVGDENKRAFGKIVDTDIGDNGCYLTLKDGKGAEFIELGKLEFCTQKPSLKGKDVHLTYKLETLPATSCNGDPKCKKTENVAFVVEVKVQN